MKKQLKKYSTLFLVFNILLASNGFAFQKQLCKVKNESNVSLTDSKCCNTINFSESESLPLSFNKSSCCSVLKIKNQNTFHYSQNEKIFFYKLISIDSNLSLINYHLHFSSKKKLESKFSKKPPLLIYHFDSSFLKSFLI